MGIVKLLFDILADICSAIITAIFDCIKAFIEPNRKTELNAAFLPASELLSSSNTGFCLTGKKCLSTESSFKNALIIGGTGAFKSSGILIPSLLKMRGHSSIIVTDFSGELKLKTSGAYVDAGYDVGVIDFGNPDGSEGYNPLDHLSNMTSEVLKLSKMGITTALGANGKDPFWNLASEGLCSLMTKYTVQYAPKECRSLYNVYHLISAMGHSAEKVDRLFVEVNDPELLAEYKTFIGYGDKVLASIIATCRAALAIFGTDPNVALATSHNTIDFASFRKQRKIFYLTANTKDMRYYSLVTSLFLEQCFGEVMSHLPEDGDLPIFFLIDEASSLYFSQLQLVCSNIRKFNAGILQIYQSASQLVDLYTLPVAKSITENCYAKVYMGGQSIDVAETLERTLGKFEYEDDKGVRHIRSLMTADEIRQSDECLILCGNKPAIKTKITPYFKQPKMTKLTELPPYQSTNKLPFTKPPLLPMDLP